MRKFRFKVTYPQLTFKKTFSTRQIVFSFDPPSRTIFVRPKGGVRVRDPDVTRKSSSFVFELKI